MLDARKLSDGIVTFSELSNIGPKVIADLDRKQYHRSLQN